MNLESPTSTIPLDDNVTNTHIPTALAQVPVLEVMATMEIDGTLNIFEQRPIWSRLAINLAFCFRLSEKVEHAVINKKLQDALDALIDSFPWIAGQVVTKGRNVEGNSGVSRIIADGGMPEMISRDHRKTPSIPSM